LSTYSKREDRIKEQHDRMWLWAKIGGACLVLLVVSTLPASIMWYFAFSVLWIGAVIAIPTAGVLTSVGVIIASAVEILRIKNPRSPNPWNE